MSTPRVPLYDRLPAIYRIRDLEQTPQGQLKAYLALVEAVFGAIHQDIETLYQNLFIETADEWAIPYIGDLLGTTPLTGEAWTRRADVADTIALRRRKGTLLSIQMLTYDLTQWGVYCVELRERMVWNQHLNHQRPDVGGLVPAEMPTVTRFTPPYGGLVPLREPAMLSLLGTPFDPFAHVADLRPRRTGSVRYNLPDLAIYLWRLEDYRVRLAKPVVHDVIAVTPASPDKAAYVVRVDIHPLAHALRLFNTYQYDAAAYPPELTVLDGTPGPILPARLEGGSEAGHPSAYVAVDTYDPTGTTTGEEIDIADVGLQFHVPEPEFVGAVYPDADPPAWQIRSENLCAWEDGVYPPVHYRDIVIDPLTGRVVFGVGSQAEGDALRDFLLITYTYGAPGKVGAHPISREAAPITWDGAAVDLRVVNGYADPAGLQTALDNIGDAAAPVVVEIRDSLTHELDPLTLAGTLTEAGGENLVLAHTLVIRASDGERPVIRLTAPLRFRPKDAAQAAGITVRLEGVYLAPGDTFPAGEALIERAAVDSLEIVDSTLMPGGQRVLGDPVDSRAAMQVALRLREPYGFASAADETAFDQTPRVTIQRSICGGVWIDEGYRLNLIDSIVDAGVDLGDPSGTVFALTGASDPLQDWGAPTHVENVTFFGPVRVISINGEGGIWPHPLVVHNDQIGCLRYSYFAAHGNRLPQNLGCVYGDDADLRFTSVIFEHPAYGQLALTADFRIRERGPGDDEMGAYGLLQEAHKWRNLQTRFRQFMPIGVLPLLIPVT
jgi:hypothetical protein